MSDFAQRLLGQWVVELVHGYLAEQKRTGGDKLFTKIAGIDDDAWPAVLHAFRQAESRLEAFYRPVLRTLSHVAGFDTYQCREHETSTWLRNNTPTGSALLIFMNDATPEAQSLENIFTIDEARLLGDEGIDVLLQLLAATYKCYSEERETLQRFLEMYRRIADPQLRSLIEFLAAVMQDKRLSMVDKIQGNMEQMRLFRDRKLTFNLTDGLARLKRNYQLSHLEQGGKAAKKEEYKDNLYAFIERSSGEQDGHELWESVHPDEFRRQALDFIHNQSHELLAYEYEHVAAALCFRERKPTLNQRINDFREAIEAKDEWRPEHDRMLTEALEAIDESRSPEAVQDFIDEFADDLTAQPKLRKELERKVERLRQQPVYSELGEALLKESFLLLEEYAVEHSFHAFDFVLRVADSDIEKRSVVWLRFHLLQLERLTGYIRFDGQSLNKPTSDTSKESDLALQLSLRVGGQEVASSHRFKLVDYLSGELSGMLGRLAETGTIPYVREYYGPELQDVDLVRKVKADVGGYIATNQAGVQEAADAFYAFMDFYTQELQRALSDGLGSVDMTRVESELESLLRPAYRSALTSKHIYQVINCIGAYDRYDGKSSDPISYVLSRELTLLNPLRLIGYAKRLQALRTEIGKWESNSNRNVEVEMDVYMQQLQEHTAHLAPRYFAIDGLPDRFLIEQQERMGEGTFVLSGTGGGEEKLVDMFADEFLSTVKTYLEVYPYAHDCLDIVFLFCPFAEYVTNAIDQIFRHTQVRKVKATVHSHMKGAAIHEYLNNWMLQEERFTEQYDSFPKVEIQVIAEQSTNAMMKSVADYLLDADLGVLVNYFGQSSHVQYKLEKVASVKDSTDWFEIVYKEPLKKDDALKRISFVSEKLPKAVQSFYQMQYVLNGGEAIGEDEHYLLRNIISIAKREDTEIINFMHDKFNWSLFIDRYLDKSLLRQVSSKAQIIKYKSSAGKNKEFRTLLSSSTYIRKLANELNDHAYYDRLYQKFRLLLKNDDIDRQRIVDATERVKEISGGIVLRAIGPGKFAHEMMAIYLSTQARAPQSGELVVWSVCDELPWFHVSKRRPDLVRTSIRRDGEGIRLQFELVELKFIADTIFERERYDAIKQVKAGVDLYRKRFAFREQPTSAELWRKELVHYLLEYGTYSVEDAKLLKDLQDICIEKIEVGISGSIDTFVYTSNMVELSIMENSRNGYQSELLNNELNNHIYNRAYILRSLGVVYEAAAPVYEGLQEVDAFVHRKLGIEPPPADGDEAAQTEREEAPTGALQPEPEATASLPERSDESASSILAHAQQEAAPANETTSDSGIESRQVAVEATALEADYPELRALANEAGSEAEPPEDVTALIERYCRKLKYSFNQVGIPITIVESIVGVSVIRLVLELQGVKSYSSIENRAKDIYLWLQLSSVPSIALRNGRINIDINRETPETVYFENFMKQAREQYPASRLKDKLVAPIGVGQLRELIALDFSSPNTPHLLIGGTTGSGKSVTINSIILALMCLYDPSEVQFVFIDPKKVEFLTYEHRIHTRQVIIEIEEAVAALEQLVEEMERRYRLFASESVTSIDEYVDVTGTAMPRLVMVFDEFADFMERESSLSGRVENAILRLGAKARASGIHLMICTQSPRADIVPTNIRNNLPARLALKAADHHASKIIINEEGAEKLGGRGDFLIKLDAPETVRGKSPFLTPRVKRALLKHFHRGEEL